MSQNPTIEFDVTTGSEYSTGTAGPLAIENSLNNLKNSFITHKDPADNDHDGRYYTEDEVDAKLQAMTQGAVADDSIINSKLGADVKVGSLAALLTSDKDSVTDAINELVNDKITKTLLTAQGDIIYASAASTPARLAKGTAGQVLQMNSGATAPEWSDGVALVKIAEVTLGANAASIDFASIPQTFKHLILKGSIRSTVAASLDDVLVRFNGNSSAVYQNKYIGGNAGTVTDYTAHTQTSIKAGRCVGDSATANYFTSIEMSILDYASTSKMKGLLFESVSSTGPGTSSQWQFNGGGWIDATAAISSLSIFNTGQFVTGTTLTLYGVK